MAFQSLMAMSFSEPVIELVNYFGGLQTIKGALERLEDVYRLPARSPPTPSPRMRFPPKLAGQVELHNVSFGYSVLEPPLLADLSLNVPPGSGSRSSVPPAAESRPSAN